jgi:hypothetical protein
MTSNVETCKKIKLGMNVSSSSIARDRESHMSVVYIFF